MIAGAILTEDSRRGRGIIYHRLSKIIIASSYISVPEPTTIFLLGLSPWMNDIPPKSSLNKFQRAYAGSEMALLFLWPPL